jgi:alpha-tubulin suppressor-like RCC1 family protein
MKAAKTKLVGLGALVLLGTLIAFFQAGRGQRGIVLGKSLPIKVTPRIAASAWGKAAMIASDGSLWLWGNEMKEFGLLISKPVSEIPLQVGKDKDWVNVAAGSGFVVVLKRNGSLWSAGRNQDAVLGARDVRSRTNLVQIDSGHDWTDIQAGAAHCVALKRDGSAWVWGANNAGQSSPQSMPVKRLDNAMQVAAGSFNSFVLKRDGTIWAWGLDMEGAANILSPQQLDPGNDWIKIAAGSFHLLALKRDGTLWLAGQNAHEAGGSYITNKTVTGRSKGFAQISGATNWVDFVCGQNFFFAKKSDGSWWAMGNNQGGQLTLGTVNSFVAPIQTVQRLQLEARPLAIGCGDQSTFMLFEDGSLWSWGLRVGAPPRTITFPRTRQFINSITLKAAKKRLFDLSDSPPDLKPHKLGTFGIE